MLNLSLIRGKQFKQYPIFVYQVGKHQILIIEMDIVSWLAWLSVLSASLQSER